MSFTPLAFLYASASRQREQGYILESGGPPSLGSLLGERVEVYVDAGSRMSTRLAKGYVLKLAILERRISEDTVEEEVKHPLPVAQDREMPPLYIGTGSEKQRYAAMYVAELAALLYYALHLPEQGVSGRLLLIRHGPLLPPMPQIYLAKSLDVPRGEAERLLAYVGLSDDYVERLLRDAEVYGPGGGGQRVSLGLLGLRILYELYNMAESGVCGVGGVIENTRGPRSLIGVEAARILGYIAYKLKPYGDTWSASQASTILAGMIDSGYKELGDKVRRGLGIDPDDYSVDTDTIIKAVKSVLEINLHGVDFTKADPGDLAVAALQANILPDLTDTEFIYLLHYLGVGPQGQYPITRQERHYARFKLLQLRLLESGSRRIVNDSWLRDALASLSDSLVFQYISPVRLPRLEEVEERLRGTSLEPYILLDAIPVPPPLRIEYFSGMPLDGVFRALVFYSSQLVLYRYPPQLLVVDSQSRVRLAEVLGAEEAVAALQGRLRPYWVYLRGWGRRIESMYGSP